MSVSAEAQCETLLALVCFFGIQGEWCNATGKGVECFSVADSCSWRCSTEFKTDSARWPHVGGTIYINGPIALSLSSSLFSFRVFPATHITLSFLFGTVSHLSLLRKQVVWLYAYACDVQPSLYHSLWAPACDPWCGDLSDQTREQRRRTDNPLLPFILLQAPFLFIHVSFTVQTPLPKTVCVCVCVCLNLWTSRK